MQKGGGETGLSSRPVSQAKSRAKSSHGRMVKTRVEGRKGGPKGMRKDNDEAPLFAHGVGKPAWVEAQAARGRDATVPARIKVWQWFLPSAHFYHPRVSLFA